MGILHDTEPLGPAMTETMLDPKTSLLVAQVKQAHASHRMDLSNKLLRSKHFNAPHKVVYLGDVATTLLAQLPHPETPEMEEAPGFNEQKWALITQSGDITVHISSRSYWALGLFNSGYINIITLSDNLTPAGMETQIKVLAQQIQLRISYLSEMTQLIRSNS